MTEGPRRTTRLAPATAWTNVTDAPLAGLALARESSTLLAWDEGRNVYLFGTDGTQYLAERAPSPIKSAAISDDGTLIALLLGGPRLLLLDRELGPIHDRPAPSGAAGLDVDAHGRFVAIGTKSTETTLFTRHGQIAGRIETRQPLTHLRFVPSLPILLGATGYGGLVAIQLYPLSAEKLEGEVLWEQRLLSNVGRLETNGEGTLILASCFNLGIQRYDHQGRNVGSYHLAGTSTQAIPDFPGRSIAAATLEGELYLLNQAGNVRWKTSLPRPANALVFDALGRYLIHGSPTGEIVRTDLETSPSARRRSSTDDARTTNETRPKRRVQPSGSQASSIREPDWMVEVAPTEEEAEASVLAILDEPPRIGYISRGNRLQIFSAEGRSLGQAPEIRGVGRILRTAPGTIAAATDRMIVIYDAARQGAYRVDLNLYMITHLIVRPDSFGLAIAEERDRLGRATVAGRWIWRRELRVPAEEIALGPLGMLAVSTDDGMLLVLDAAGEPAGQFTSDPAEPLLLVEAPEAPGGERATWITLARRAQILRGHRADGQPLWETPVPWEAWQMDRLGSWIVAAAPDGRLAVFDGSGDFRGQAPALEDHWQLALGPSGELLRVSRRDVHLICADLSGQVIWRTVADAPLGPLATGRIGVAAIIGKSLAFFANPDRE